MAWSIRKTLRLLPGVRLNLSKSGPRLSVGIPGARASIGLNGKTRLYASKGPVRFQKSLRLPSCAWNPNSGITAVLAGWLKRKIR